MTDLRLKQNTDLLESLISLDGLAEIANRRRFDEQIAIEWSRARRHQDSLSFMLRDVDYFGRFNDRDGHARRDDCLKAVVKARTQSFHRASDFAATYGAKEFEAILPDVDMGGAD